MPEPKSLGTTVLSVPKQGLTVNTGASAANWFGPLNPQAPSAQQVAGRVFDFENGYNIQSNPRTGNISFGILRAVAQNCDLLRLCIETRKDQIESLGWTIQPREGVLTLPNQEARASAVTAFFQRPNGRHTWGQWIRMMMEEVLVTDAPSIFVRRTRGGDLYSLRQIDGATIKPIIDPWGDVPEPGAGPAYMQNLKGITAVHYQSYGQTSRDDWDGGSLPELIYAPRNIRVHTPYGYSPTEQVIATITIAMQRQQSQTAFFSDGNMPESLIGVPEGWTVEQIKEWQAYWDGMLTGRNSERRRGKFVPGQFKYQALKETELFGKAEEWLARVICYAFSLSPQAFSQQMNRATAEVASESAKDEGMVPLRKYISALIGQIIDVEFGSPDLELRFNDEEKLQAETRRKLAIEERTAGLISVNEARMVQGLARTGNPDDDVVTAEMPARPVALPAVTKAHVHDDNCGHAKVEKANLPRNHPLNPTRKSLNRITRSITGTLEDGLQEVAEIAASDALRMIKVEKAWNGVLNAKWPKALADLIASIVDDLVNAGQDAATAAAGLIGYGNFDKVNERAAILVRERSAALVTNITETTRDMLREVIDKGLTENVGRQVIADRIAASTAFSPARADLIARTEISWANSHSSLETYKEAEADGVVVKKEWLLGENPCEICLENAAAGAIGLDDKFPSGDQCPPCHPNCECATSPVVE